MKTLWRILKVAVMVIVLGFLGLWLAAFIRLDRTREFRTQARLGQPIVQAIGQFKGDTGAYPVSLTNLCPRYLSEMPDMPNVKSNKFEGWEYRTTTNASEITFTLRYYMGRGGIEYEPPNWYGNDEGHRSVILRNR